MWGDGAFNYLIVVLSHVRYDLTSPDTIYQLYLNKAGACLILKPEIFQFCLPVIAECIKPEGIMIAMISK